MRDLEKDLDICNAATPGTWECWLSAVQSGWMVRVGRGEYCDSINTAYYPENKIRTEGYGCDNTFIADLNDDEYHTYSSLQEQIANAKFIAEAREGWPHAIERAIKAEMLKDILNKELYEKDGDLEELRTENARLRKVAEAAREFFEDTGCKPKECKKCDPKYINFCERSRIGQALAELDKEGE